MSEDTERNEAKAAETPAASEEAAAPPPPPAGGIENLGFLDLRGASEEDLAKIAGITNVGTILLSEHLRAAVARIPMKNVGSVVPLPDDVRLKLQMGEIRLSGEALAGGDPDELLFVMGELTISAESVKENMALRTPVAFSGLNAKERKAKDLVQRALVQA
jgi:hypothetical protein